MSHNIDCAELSAKYDLIYDCLPGGAITKIRVPQIMGSQKNVLVADTSTGSYIFKFDSDRNLIRRNEVVSHVFKSHNIPVPDVTMYEHNGAYAEVYHMICGHTLYEYLGQNISKTELLKIYTEILNHFQAMSQIDYAGLNFYGFKTPTDIARKQLCNSNGGLLATISTKMVGLMNIGTNNGLYHHGITPKNIIIDDTGRLAGFIDVEEIGLCNEHYAFGVMAGKAQLYGIAPDLLCNMWETISGHTLSRNWIKTIARINNMGRTVLWRQATSKNVSGK